MADSTPAAGSELSNTVPPRRRFWTSETSSSRSLCQPASVNISNPLSLPTLDKVNKRPFVPTLDQSVVFPAPKRSKMAESTPAVQSELSDSFRSRRRFWTSEMSSSRSLYRPSSVSISKPLLLSMLDKRSDSAAPTNVFSITPRPFSHSAAAMSTTNSSTSSIAALTSVSEISRQVVAKNSETRRILKDLERVGGLPTMDSRRPRLWFQSIPEETLTARLSEKKRGPFGPPTTSLRTVDQAQILPRVVTSSDYEALHRSVHDERPPPIAVAAKRTATNETTGQHVPQETATTIFGKKTFPSSCKFTFTKPLIVSVSSAVEKPVVSVTDIPHSKMVPFSAAQVTPSVPTSGLPKLGNGGTAKGDAPALNAKSKWSCSTCFVSNDASANECACCKTEKPNVRPKPSGSDVWCCECCSVKNEVSSEKCVACDSKRFSQKEVSKTHSGETTAPALDTKSKWSCSTCFVSNDASANECVCCNTAKPNIQPKPSSGGVWCCGCCSVKNEVTSEKCVACGTERSSRKDASKAESGDKKLSNWSCTTCFLSNAAERVKCIACQSPKPGAAFKPVRLGMSLFGSADTSASTVAPISTFPSKPGVPAALPTSETAAKPAPSFRKVATEPTLNANGAATTIATTVTSGAAPIGGFPFSGFGTSGSVSSSTKFGAPDLPTSKIAVQPDSLFGKITTKPMVNANGAYTLTTTATAPAATAPGFGFSGVSTNAAIPSAPKFGISDLPTRVSAIPLTGSFGKVSAEPSGNTNGANTTTTTTTATTATVVPAAAPGFAFSGLFSNAPVSTTFQFGMSSDLPASKPSFQPLSSFGKISAVVSNTNGADATTTTAAPATVAPGLFSFSGFGTKAPVSTFPSKFGASDLITSKSAVPLLPSFGKITAEPAANVNGAGTTTTTAAATAPGGFTFTAFGTTNSFSMEKSNGDSKSPASVVFPTLPTSHLFNMTKSNGGTASPLPPVAFPTLPTSNPFSVTQSSSTTPIGARRHLVAKRKVKRP